MADDGDSTFTSSVEEQDSIAKAKSPQKTDFDVLDLFMFVQF